MPRSPQKNQTKYEFLMLSPALCALFLYLVPVYPIAHEMWKTLNGCRVNSCSNIEAIASIVGTIFVVTTLIFAIRSSNNRDKKMNDNIKILVQNNRMKYLKEYMTALSIKIYSNIDDTYLGKGLNIVEGKNGVIFRWNILRSENKLDYRFCTTFRSLSPEEEDIREILKGDPWWNFSIEIIRINKTTYVMTGYAIGEDFYYLPIESKFQNMNDDQYNNVMMVILATTGYDIERLMETQDELQNRLNQ